MNSKNILVNEQSGDSFYIAQFKTTELAIFSYYIESNKECLLIDPTINVSLYLQFISQRHATLKYVLLSHYHADFISGHTEFKVPIVMGPHGLRACNKFKVNEEQDGQSIPLGNCKVSIIHTPGHTLESSCFLLKDSHGHNICLFTGDTVFLGDVGRPDLAVSSNITKEDLAAMLFDSLQKLKLLDGNLRIYPGHGGGSACGKAIGAGNFCSLGEQMKKNYGLKMEEKQKFIAELTANMQQPPRYFFFDAKANQVGPSHYNTALKRSCVALPFQQFNKLRPITKILDTRKQPNAGIIRGSYWLPQSGPIANLISNFIAPTDDLLLVTDEGCALEVTQRLLRIGYQNIKGHNSFDINELNKDNFIKPTIVKFITLKHIHNAQHLDVRNPPEYKALGVIQNAILVPLSQLESRVGELKGKKDLVINCLTGYRSKIAFSILAKHGIESKILVEDFKEFKNNGLSVIDYN